MTSLGDTGCQNLINLGGNQKTKIIGLYSANYYCHFLFYLSKLIFSLRFEKYYPTIVQTQVFKKQLHIYKNKTSRVFFLKISYLELWNHLFANSNLLILLVALFSRLFFVFVLVILFSLYQFHYYTK